MKKEIDLSEMHINLRELWTLNYNQCPSWVDSCNVIYKIKNLINGKVYIGQARYFYNRFVTNDRWSHYGSLYEYCKGKYTNSKLYNALRKYHSRNFEVSIIDILNSSEELNDKEIERIAEFDSFNNGYNLTSGGTHHEQLHTPEAIALSMRNNRKNHGGILAWNLSENREKGLETTAAKYNGDCMGQCHTPEAYETQMRNHGGMMACHTPEVRARVMAINAANYNGDCMGQCHTPEAVAKSHAKSRKTIMKRYNGDPMGQCNTPEAREKANKSIALQRSFDAINYCLEDIRKWHPDFKKIDFDIYWIHTPYYSSAAYNHIRNVLKKIDLMRSDERWTPEMEEIFGYIENHRKEYKI